MASSQSESVTGFRTKTALPDWKVELFMVLSQVVTPGGNTLAFQTSVK